MPDEKVNGKLVVTDKIGIGIEEPIAQLHIASSTTAPSQAFLESSGALLKLSVDASGAAIGTDNAFPLSIKTDDISRISVSQTGNVTISEALSVQKSLTVSGNVGIGTTSPSYKLAIAAGDINIDDGSALRQAGRWVIGGNPNVLSIGSSNASDGRDISFDPGFAGALTIKKDTGNVGIGTASPRTKLEVYGGRLRVSTSDANSAGVIELSNGSKTNYVFTDGSTGDLLLRTDSPNHDILLQEGGSQGKVGIGTSDPKAKLEVAGDLRADTIHSTKGFKFPDGTVQTTAIRIASGRVGFDRQSGEITNRRIVQLSGFNQNPTVLVALATIDADRNANLRINTFVDNITKDSFEICLFSWADTTIWSAQVTWIAFGS